jgi:hypothetical protein
VDTVTVVPFSDKYIVSRTTRIPQESLTMMKFYADSSRRISVAKLLNRARAPTPRNDLYVSFRCWGTTVLSFSADSSIADKIAVTLPSWHWQSGEGYETMKYLQRHVNVASASLWTNRSLSKGEIQQTQNCKISFSVGEWRARPRVLVRHSPTTGQYLLGNFQGDMMTSLEL